MNKTELYTKALEKWGDQQYIILFEEMAELTKELTKDLRGKGNTMRILEELADVEICLEQMKVKFGDITDFKAKKLERLRKKVLEGTA
jgi:hypothetical protein